MDENNYSLVDILLKGLDYAGGLGRVSGAGLVNIPYSLSTGQSLTKEDDVLKALRGEAPSTAEYLNRAGVSGTSADVLGFVGDVALDPTTYLSGGATKAPMVMGAVGPLLKNKKWLTMTAEGLEKLGLKKPEALKQAVRQAQIEDRVKLLEKLEKEKTYFKKLDEAKEQQSLLKKLDTTPENYPEMIRVQQTWPWGEKSVDWMTGLNKGHAEQRARYNWPAADKIETMGTLKNPSYKKK